MDLQRQAFNGVTFNRLDVWVDTWFRMRSFKYYINVNQHRAGYISGFICRKRLHIQYFLLEPTYQGKGVGPQVIKQLERESQKYNKVTLHTRESNHSMNKMMANLGFTKVDEISNYYKDGETAYYYSRHSI